MAQEVFIKTLHQKSMTTTLQLKRHSLSILSGLGTRVPALDLFLLLHRILREQVNQLRPIALTASSVESEGYLGTVESRWHLGGDLMKIHLRSRRHGHRQPHGRADAFLLALVRRRRIH